jgi:serine/threonine protein kinase
MSPEALAMEPPAASFDLWSLAVTLFEALTGRNPFLGGDVDATLQLIRRAQVPDPTTLRPGCSPALATLLTFALSSRREERPVSARAFHDALNRCRPR